MEVLGGTDRGSDRGGNGRHERARHLYRRQPRHPYRECHGGRERCQERVRTIHAFQDPDMGSDRYGSDREGAFDRDTACLPQGISSGGLQASGTSSDGRGSRVAEKRDNGGIKERQERHVPEGRYRFFLGGGEVESR